MKTNTPIQFTGPAKGDPAVGGAEQVIGTIATIFSLKIAQYRLLVKFFLISRFTYILLNIHNLSTFTFYY